MKTHGLPALGLALIVVGVVLGAMPPAHAGTFDAMPKILIHVGPPSRSGGCQTGILPDCQSATVTAGLSGANGPFYYAYLVVALGRAANLAGLQCGINYQDGQPGGMSDGSGIDIFSWTRCADAEWATSGQSAWPAPGTGIIITWDRTRHCQTGQTAVAGYFYMAAYSEDVLQVTRRPVDTRAAVISCEAVELTLRGQDLGSARFTSGSTRGCNPCLNRCPDPPTPPPPDPPPPPLPPSPTTSEPRILLHIGTPATHDQCAAGTLGDPAAAVVSARLSTKESGPFYFVYLLVAPERLNGVAGFDCGISYENGLPEDISNGSGIDIFSWTRCATAEISTTVGNRWPQPGSGNIITWDYTYNCQTGATAVAGYFYLAAYTPDRLSIVANPTTGYAEVSDCTPAEFRVESARLGYVEFSNESTTTLGCNPWLRNCATNVPVLPTTWGAVKALYRRS